MSFKLGKDIKQRNVVLVSTGELFMTFMLKKNINTATNMNKKKFNAFLKIQNNPKDQNLKVPVYVNQKFKFSDEIKNNNDVYGFQYFVKILCQNVSNFDNQRDKHEISQHQHLIHLG
ncbi:6691_t:CDS:2 [Gigaspora margarita]|uniref:6691_t:CDS:1 n=1 Tax=Gigaspora margarita TaxID=4874 RepID=A0ABM8VX52_GIGMA|nr:6691_t:CDS:2 [Gigaspora margarita]